MRDKEGQLYDNAQGETDDKEATKQLGTIFDQIQSSPKKTVRKLIAESSKQLRPRTSTWQRYRRKYRRGLKYLNNVSSQSPLYSTNYIFTMVESTKSNLTKNLPPLVVLPKGSRDDLSADTLTRILRNELYTAGIKQVTREVVHNAAIISTGVFKTYFSDSLDRIVIEGVNFENLYIDPFASNLESAKWVIQKTPDVSIGEINATYGSIPTSEGDTFEDINNAPQDNSRSKRENSNVVKTYDVYEAWIRVYDKNAENNWFIITVAGDTVLRQEFSVYEHNEHPYNAWFAVEDYGATDLYTRGVGVVEEIESLQDRADALDYRIYNHIKLLTNRQRYVSAQSGLNTTAIDNTAGRTYKVNGDADKAVHYDNPPQLPLEVYTYRSGTEGQMQTVSGIFDVTQGKRPTGITAGRAIESLKDSAETRLAVLGDTLADVLEKVADKALKLILQLYSGERIINATDGDKDDSLKIIAEYPDELRPQPVPILDEMGQPKMNEETGEMMIDDSDMEITPELEEKRKLWRQQNQVALVLEDVDYKFDIKASADSALPSARQERSQIASDLFRLGAIDREALLTAIDFPERHKILQRLASEVTGQNAGEGDAEAGQGMAQQMMEQFEQVLIQLGLDEQTSQQVLAQMAQQMQGGAGKTPPSQQTGQFKPQMTQ